MLDQSLFPNFITRSEIKLRLTAEEADIFAAEIKRHLPVYCYSPGRETTFVTTVYFDTDDFRFYSRANKFRDDNLKLRLKEYLSLIHISEPTRLLSISYAVFCLKKKKMNHINTTFQHRTNSSKYNDTKLHIPYYQHDNMNHTYKQHK